MATTHAPGTGIGPGAPGRHGRRTTVIAAVVLATLAIVVPFGLHGLQRDHAPASAATHEAGGPAPPATQHHQGRADSSLGPRSDLPPLLPDAAPGLSVGQTVRVGDITDGALRRTPTGVWQVVVRWDGRLQPLAVRGPASLGATSWVSRAGILYTRVTTATSGRFQVFAWDPEGGSAYSPPALVATSLGDVCFNASFTAFGNCHAITHDSTG
jgi:hypothetical protein